MSRVTKSEAEDFASRVRETLQARGAVPERRVFGDAYTLRTRAGSLTLCVPFSNAGSRIYTVYGVFADPERAHQSGLICLPVRANPYSGKCNFHFDTADECIRELRWTLDRLALPVGGALKAAKIREEDRLRVHWDFPLNGSFLDRLRDDVKHLLAASTDRERGKQKLIRNLTRVIREIERDEQ